jgi:hypothetical protein
MDKYIGFDISSKDVSVCIIQKNERERCATIGPDAWSVLLNADGKANNEYFIADKLHMNEKGYHKWTQVLRPVIEREFIRKSD